MCVCVCNVFRCENVSVFHIRIDVFHIHPLYDTTGKAVKLWYMWIDKRLSIFILHRDS